MNQHPLPEQIAAYLAGDADEAVSTHVRGCVQCAQTMRALEQTVADLRAMPDPEPREADLRAWRAAIAAKKASRTPLVWRWATAAAGVAAVLIGFMAFSGGDGIPARDETFSPTLRSDGADMWTPASVRALVEGEQGAAAGNTTSESSASESVPADMRAEDDAGASGNQEASPEDRAAACHEAVATKKHPRPTVLWGSWEGTPAWVLLYEMEDGGREAWVVAQADCRTLFFAQSDGRS